LNNHRLITPKCFALGIALATLAPTNVLANPIYGSSAFEKAASEAVEHVTREDSFSGVILVARDNHVLLRSASGLADRSRNIPNTIETKFPLESITKQFTAAAILLLIEDGKVSLADPIAKYYPTCPSAWREITIKQLLTHSSGINDNAVDFRSYRDFKIAVGKAPLAFPAGSDFLYSNVGYGLLTGVIEDASDQSYADFVRGRIFVPLGMRNTGYGEIPGHGVKGYIHAASGASGQDEWQGGTAARLEEHGGFGGLYSTIDDMLIWSRALASDKLLSSMSRQEMLTDYGHNYGFGWRFATKFGRKLVWHTGNDNRAGFASIFDYFPEEGLTVVALTNNVGLTNFMATLTVEGKPMTFPATAARKAVEQVERLYFMDKPEPTSKTSN